MRYLSLPFIGLSSFVSVTLVPVVGAGVVRIFGKHIHLVKHFTESELLGQNIFFDHRARSNVFEGKA